MADGSSGKGGNVIVSNGEGDGAHLVDVSLDEMVTKAHGGSSVGSSNKLAMPDEDGNRLTRSGALAPFYDPYTLALTVELSTVLGPAIRALQSNVDGHGFTLKPRIDLDDPKIRDTVADAITLERMMSTGLRNPRAPMGELIPSTVEVNMRLSEIQTRLRIEHARAMAFFSACCPGIGRGFTWCRKELRRDRESMGAGYLGVIRNGFGEPAQFEPLPGVQMRLRPVVKDRLTGHPTTVTVEVPVRTTPISVEFHEVEMGYRTFVQFGLTRDVFFKEYGDPRVFSANDGHEYPSVAELPTGHRPATEVIHLKISSSLTEYGVPQWIGAAPCVSGLRASEEVNAQHFDDNGIPRMMVIVSGGTMKDGADKVLADAFKAHTKGRKNYGGMIIICANPSSDTPGARVQIEVKSLKEAIPGDGLFQTYAGNMRDVALSQMRIPKFVLGILNDVNKSSAEEGREFVENEVYQPMRQEFDEVMTGFLESIGVYHWTFASNSPISRDPVTMIDMLEKASKAGGATIDDARTIMGDAFNMRFPPTDDALGWGKMPIALASLHVQATAQKAGLGAPAGSPQSASTIAGLAPTTEDTAKSSPVTKSRPVVKSQAELVRYLEAVRDQFDENAASAQAFEVETAEGENLLVLPMSAAQIADLVE